MTALENELAKVLAGTLRSPNESDSNGEVANVVDGLFAIARAIDGLTHAAGEMAQAIDNHG